MRTTSALVTHDLFLRSKCSAKKYMLFWLKARMALDFRHDFIFPPAITDMPKQTDPYNQPPGNSKVDGGIDILVF